MAATAALTWNEEAPLRLVAAAGLAGDVLVDVGVVEAVPLCVVLVLEVELRVDVPVPVLLPVPVPVVDALVELPEEAELSVSPMANEPVEEYTSSTFPILTASSVYPPRTGTTGSVTVIDPWLTSMLLAMANESLNSSFMSSRVKVSGSPGAWSQVIVTSCEFLGSSGIWRVRAETRGVTRARRASLQNIVEDSLRRALK